MEGRQRMLTLLCKGRSRTSRTSPRCLTASRRWKTNSSVALHKEHPTVEEVQRVLISYASARDCPSSETSQALAAQLPETLRLEALKKLCRSVTSVQRGSRTSDVGGKSHVVKEEL
eukprot:symbB.v1.2.005367.t1/scaffold313.1/size231106/3